MYYVYIMTNCRGGVLYVGVTNDLVVRVFQHKSGSIEGFTKTHRLHTLVHFESTEDVREAIRREKQLKHWRRAWKIELIEQNNPQWEDLYPAVSGTTTE